MHISFLTIYNLSIHVYNAVSESYTGLITNISEDGNYGKLLQSSNVVISSTAGNTIADSPGVDYNSA